LAAALIGSAVLVVHHDSVGEIISANWGPKQASLGLPARIIIPNINVNAPIEDVGVTPAGDMDTPKLQFDTAWYNLGPRPGEIGSAVIAGHKDWKNGENAIFEDLHKLKPGDKVIVEDDRGSLMTFIVRTSQAYNPDSDATNIFRSNDGKAHLNLITCQGAWDKNAKSYSQRLVVFTDKE
jgi:sortase A